MADLSPDLSPYQALSKQPQGGIGSMDVGSLLSLVGRARELQTQSAVSDAMRASQNDPGAALRSLMQPGAPGFVNPETYSALTHAAAAKTELQQAYFNTMADSATSLLGSGRPITDTDIHNLAIQMTQRGVPENVATDFINSMPTDQKGRQFRLAQIQNLRAGGATPPIEWLPTGPGGSLEPQTGAAVRYGQYAPPSEAQTSVPGGPRGTQAKTLPAGTQEGYTESAANAGHLQDRSLDISRQRSLLAQMSDLVGGAETGGTLSTLRMHINQTMAGLGLPAIDEEEKLTKTQLFNKFASQLQQQQAGGWPTEKNLSSVYSANPSLQLTKLGNRGVLAFLQGNLDTENLVLQQWNQWKAAHGGGQELNFQFRDWINDTLKPQYGRGFNANPNEAPGTGGLRNFDPRILQFERLTPDEQRQFVADMSDSDKAVFARNLNRYKKFAYLESAQR